jgi:hypothetical protein
MAGGVRGILTLKRVRHRGLKQKRTIWINSLRLRRNVRVIFPCYPMQASNKLRQRINKRSVAQKHRHTDYVCFWG